VIDQLRSANQGVLNSGGLSNDQEAGVGGDEYLALQRELKSFTSQHREDTRELETLREQLRNAENRALSLEGQLKIAHSDQARYGRAINIADIESQLTRFPEASSRQFIVVYGYTPASPPRKVRVGGTWLHEVKLREGGIVTVDSEALPDGYYVGTVNGVQGLVSAAHVEPLDSSVECARPEVMSLLAIPQSNGLHRGGLKTYSTPPSVQIV